jgi:glutathione synthase
VVNDPFWVRNSPEKLLVLRFPDLTPPTTLIARDFGAARVQGRHGDVILKPLYGNGGAGVFRLDPNDRNLAALHELFTGINREPLIAQKFLPDVAKGDKRMILVDGEAVGRDQPGAGGGRDAVEHACRRAAREGGLTARDREICARIGPLLREKGQVFVGIDVIGDWLTEINVTSPTGCRSSSGSTGSTSTAPIWEAIEAKRA